MAVHAARLLGQNREYLGEGFDGLFGLRVREWAKGIAFANLLPDRTFRMELVIEGEFNDTKEMNYTVVVEDVAGNKVSIPFKLFCDLKPPAQPSLIFT